MKQLLSDLFSERIGDLKPTSDRYATEIVDRLLNVAQESGVSDVHLLPGEGSRSLLMHWRIDGVLHKVAHLEHCGPNIVSRLKVLAELLTYRTDVPQEGRIRRGDESIEMRVSTFPTIFGEKVVVRLFVGSGAYRHLDDLGLPDDIQGELERRLTFTGGALLVTGPAGSGKTTTLYACVRRLLRIPGDPRAVCTLEDPVEAVISGASQSQVQPSAGFDYVAGLRSLMRQDPDVIMVGEIRDRETAAVVFQAALTGQLVLTSFHAGTAAESISRLLDLDVEPYMLAGGLVGVLNQRLLRRLCTCAELSEAIEERLGIDVERVTVPRGCEACRHTGYVGRTLLAEFLSPDPPELHRAILQRAERQAVGRAAVHAGMRTIAERAVEAVAAGVTSPEEFRRVFGPHGPASGAA
jgi:general secretion pathway protein E